jgi:hypothetical protein
VCAPCSQQSGYRSVQVLQLVSSYCCAAVIKSWLHDVEHSGLFGAAKEMIQHCGTALTDCSRYAALGVPQQGVQQSVARYNTGLLLPRLKPRPADALFSCQGIRCGPCRRLTSVQLTERPYLANCPANVPNAWEVFITPFQYCCTYCCDTWTGLSFRTEQVEFTHMKP